ncbi:outer membrane receptor protein involved in Fe transport [Sphingobium sp. JAI105]|uniref:TonB-dependent receptor plug domain-containing protein n=1 Tax=Sphingobium sp. JAI105 TaxID=2787715 RepID=UPI0018C927F8|nr:TonB-dependent receptor [Sphingobium sp. JAI105]MBG6118462.1 outer membrane receptor protein involved in Fe transport [Sphingobium sp. JAI105]
MTIGRYRFQLAVSATALIMSASAMAQTAGPQAPAGAEADGSEIVVTGSRIKRPNETQATPITTVSTAAIEGRGVVNVVEVLATVPAAGASRQSPSGNPRDQGSTGTYTADLRALGNTRTLVLVDGQRYVGTQQGTNAVDISTIPTDLIERVDVTTGGASAVYGSDAISGVVNFILKKNYQGIKLNAQSGISTRGDGRQSKLSGLFGTNFADDRGNVTFAASWDQTKGVLAVDREISADGVTIADPTRPDLAVFGPAGYTVAQTRQGVFGLNGSTIAGSTIRRTILADGTVTTPLASRDGINPNQFVIMSVPMERVVTNLRGRYAFTDDITGYIDGTFARTDVTAQLDQTYVTSGRMNIGGPTGLPITIPTTSPFIPAALRALIPAGRTEISVGRDLPEFGGRLIKYRRELYRAVAGVDVKLPFLGDSWNANAYYEYGRSTLDQTMFNGYNSQRMYEALRVESNGAGGFQCASASARAQGCIPVNLFTGRALTSAEMNYLRQNADINSFNEQQVVAGSISGTLIELPAGPLGFAAGAEYRNERSNYLPDDNLQNGLTSLQYYKQTKGQFNVKEAYAELSVPLLKDVPLVHSLEVEGAYRYADYSSSGGISAWKVGGNYSPISDIRFRGIYSRDIRAPNINDLFRGQTSNRVNLIDPCTAGGNAARRAYCLAQPGITTAFNPPAPSPINQFQVGNRALKPEIANTLTAGAVLTPTFIRGLSLSVDYFDIKIKNAITTLDPQVGVNLCADTSDPRFCSTVTRDPTTGILIFNNTIPINAANERMKGVDVELAYRTGLGNYGGLDMVLNYTNLIKYKTAPFAGATIINLKGQPFYPEHKANLNLTYSLGGFSVNLNERYIGKIYRVVGGTFAGNAVPAFWYTDLQVRYSIDKKYDLYIGGKNIFDKKPPLFPTPYVGTTTGTNTAGAVYDVIGAYVYAGVSLKF